MTCIMEVSKTISNLILLQIYDCILMFHRYQCVPTTIITATTNNFFLSSSLSFVLVLHNSAWNWISFNLLNGLMYDFFGGTQISINRNQFGKYFFFIISIWIFLGMIDFVEFFGLKRIFKKRIEFIELGFGGNFILVGASRNETAEFGCKLGRTESPCFIKEQWDTIITWKLILKRKSAFWA